MAAARVRPVRVRRECSRVVNVGDTGEYLPVSGLKMPIPMRTLETCGRLPTVSVGPYLDSSFSDEKIISLTRGGRQ
jgi:hypothetical protein